MGYAIFFDKDNATYRLPVNPEQVEESSVQANQRYEILKLGEIVVPSHVELKEYTFEAELPKEPYHYVKTSEGFRDADFYLSLFEKWRRSLEPIRFIASNGIGDDINTLVLIESLDIIEKSGEEGDKYVSFSLLEYKEYGKKAMVIANQTSSTTKTAKKKKVAGVKSNPKNSGSYTVQAGDTLWAIAKKYYSDGSQYTKIYNANKDKIKNPNLIYPGQKLVIP